MSASEAGTAAGAGWRPLFAQAERLAAETLAGLFRDDPRRAEDFRVGFGGIGLDLSRQRLDREAVRALLAFAGERDFAGAMRALVEGEIVNPSENRAALHTALRGETGGSDSARLARAQARDARQDIERIVAGLEAAGVGDVLHVGIGGSDLGPRLVTDALREQGESRFRLRFLSSADGHALARAIDGLDPRRTAVLLVSKSFGTQETLLNGEALRQWLGDSRLLFAITAREKAALDFGIEPDRILPIWDWVGGRFSLWSAVGFSIRLALGAAGFERLLAGAATMDRHALEAPLPHNLPAWHALVSLWNRSVLGHASLAVLPYDARLALLPDYLQQLVMESLGKRARSDGAPAEVSTAPVLWGSVGASAQHSFFQALHQGSDVVPCEFIAVDAPDHAYPDHHRALLANLRAQADALAFGHSPPESDDPREAALRPHREHPGNRPSGIIRLNRLDAHRLGQLLAMYEHSVYLQSVALGVNAFDQWGVELGKRLAADLLRG
jgi:glucose-6-phosphate isomerase